MTVAWPMVTAACLTLALINLRIAMGDVRRAPYVFFFISALAVAAISVMELELLRADSLERCAWVLRWASLPLGIMWASMIGFVWSFFGTGRGWLALVGLGLSELTHFVNLVSRVPVLRHAVAIREVETFGGVRMTVPIVVTGPWDVVAVVSVILMLAFVTDASISLWKRGGRKRAVMVGGGIVFFFFVARSQATLIEHGIVQMPYLVSFTFLAVLVAMGHELSAEVFSAAKLDRDLRESEARFRTVADTAPVMIWMAGTDKLCVFFNKGWFDFTGRTLEQESGNGWAEGVHPDDFEHCLKVYTTSFDARQQFTMQYRLRRRDGAYAWVLDIGVPRIADDGTFLGYIGSCIDITTHKQEEERFRIVVESSPNAMIMVNSQGKIALVNAQTETVFGYARTELVGQSIEVLIPGRFHHHHPELRQGYLAHPTARAMGAGRELFGRCKDGSEVPVEIGLNPIQTQEGTFVLASVIDITERKMAEQEAKRHRDELAHLSRVSILGELAGAIAHELNQPLAAMLSNAQVGRRSLDTGPPDLPEMSAILDDIAHDAKRAGGIIHDMRALFRKDGHGEAQAMDLNEAVRQVVSLLHGEIVGRRARVDLLLGEDLPRVSAGRVGIQQVLINLVLNSFDASKGSAVSALVEIVTARGDGCVVLTVRDNGPGIPADLMPKLFEPFVTTKPGGLGLGLAISRGIAERFHGELTAENHPAGGAVFHLVLPLVEATK